MDKPAARLIRSVRGGAAVDDRIVYVTYDEMKAELLRLHLERNSVPCWLRSMRVGGYQGITIGPLGEIRLMTSAPYAEKGKSLIRQAIADGFLAPSEGDLEEAG